MEKVLEIQKKAFLEEGPPSLEKRKDLLRRCAALIETHEKKIIKALNHDFQNRSIEEIKISEIDQTIMIAIYVTSILNDSRFYPNLKTLALDENLTQLCK